MLRAQDKVGNWIMYFGQNKLSDKWSIHTEIQHRNHTVAPSNLEQLLLRAGINYHHKDVMISGGYAHIGSYVYESEQSAPEDEEHRIWQQFILINKINRLKIEHRYRIEERWVNKAFKSRLRYRVMAFLPINKPVIEKGTWFLALYDEIFLNTKQNYFDRNRLYGAVGYQLSQSTGIQTGMLQQETNGKGKWYLQVALTFNPKLYSKN